MSTPEAGPVPASTRRKRTKQLEVMVAEVIRETPEAATLVLFTGNDHLEYQPGHFLTIQPQQFPALERFIDYFEELKGKKEPARAYSIASAPHEGHLAITVKEEYYIPGVTPYPPLLSPLLVWRTLPGTRMKVTGFSGPYVLPSDIQSRTDHLVHICAGSGIVPNVSIIKHALKSEMKLRHTLIYGNRTYKDIIFRRSLDEIAMAYPDRFRVVHALSREDAAGRYEGSFHSGRVGLDLISETIREPTAVEVFACGPAISKAERLTARKEGAEPRPRFMESVLGALREIGVPKQAIHRESYG